MIKTAPDIGGIAVGQRLRHCVMHFTISANAQRTYLKQAYVTPPFRVVDITENKKSRWSQFMTMSSSPGILDHDIHNIQITAETGTRSVLQNQSYQRIFQMETGATLQFQLNVEEDAVLSYIQHPLVPHQRSVFRGKNRVDVAANSTLLLAETITCGRKLCGEIFQFSHFQSVTEIYLGGKLALKDNIVVRPTEIDLNAIGQMEGFTHQATLYFVKTTTDGVSNAAETVSKILDAETELEYGVSKPHDQALVVRVLAHGGEHIMDAFRKLEKALILPLES
jgi:urease accessory protein